MKSASRICTVGLLLLLALTVQPLLAADTPTRLGADPETRPACGAPALTTGGLESLLEEPVLTPVEGSQELLLSGCSGEWCGCYDPPCEEQCTGGGWQCMTACSRAQIQCAIACCGS